MIILRLTSYPSAEFLRMRSTLWPHRSIDYHRNQVGGIVENRETGAIFYALAPNNEPAGFTEVSLRMDYVSGCSTSPVGYLEGLYVVEKFRRQNIARLLVEAAENWSFNKGCTEFASDADIDNMDSMAAHTAMGFDEVSRVVCYRKSIETR